jgi:outer membrane protein assembly factor BamB
MMISPLMSTTRIERSSGQPEASSTHKRNARRWPVRPARLALILIAAIFALAACVNDLNPDGGWSAPVEEGEFFYVGSKDGRIIRITSSTSTLDQSWQYPSEGDDDLGEIYGTPAISNGVIYGSAFRCKGNDCDGEIFSVDIQTGRSAWASGPIKVESRLVSAVGIGEKTLAVGTSAVNGEDTPGGYLLGLDPTADAGRALSAQIRLREKWRIPVDGAIWGGVAVVEDVAYFGTLQGTLYAVDLADSQAYLSNPFNRVLWSFDAGGAIAGTPHVTETHIYVGSFGNSVYSLNLAHRRQYPNSIGLNPSLEWSFDTGQWVWAEPLLADGVVYVANLPGQVYALDAASGLPLWQSPAEVGKEIIGQPAIFQSARGPALAVASGEQDVEVVVLVNGQVSGQFDTNGNGIKSAPVVIDDAIFVHTDTGQFRRYQTDTLGLLKCIEAKESGKSCN